MKIFQDQREAFCKSMVSGVALFCSPPAAVRSNDVEHEYRQDSDLYYLTGLEEEGSVLVVRPAGPGDRVVMFVRPKDPEKEIWNGRRIGPEGAVSRFGADAAYPLDELRERLPGLIEDQGRLLYRLGRNHGMDEAVFAALDDIRRRARKGVRAPSEIVDPSEVLHEMRLRKSADELALMRRAAEITCEAHRAAMAACEPGVHEYELEAVLEYLFRRRGANGPGYPSIVGSGANATVLHYTDNRDRIGGDHLVLIDAGCEFENYSADVTRTFPASGRFTAPQRALYEIVLEAQLRAIETVRPGSPFEAAHQAALSVLTTGLVKLGLLEGDPVSLIEKEAYKRFYPHRTGHWLGLDVHDVGRYVQDGESRRLEPGMVLTVEPGLYVQPDDAEAAEEYRGIGIRIEDDVLVTTDGHEVLTDAAPKEIEAIEDAMRQPAPAMP